MFDILAENVWKKVLDCSLYHLTKCSFLMCKCITTSKVSNHTALVLPRLLDSITFIVVMITVMILHTITTVSNKRDLGVTFDRDF